MDNLQIDDKDFFARVDGILQAPIQNLLSVEEAAEEPWQITRQFPKACSCCGTIYQSCKEYKERTKALKQDVASTLVPFANCWIEYRNCGCGSTLVLIFSEERDVSPSGQRRRDYFWECVDKLTRKENLPMDQAVFTVRRVFRRVLGDA